MSVSVTSTQSDIAVSETAVPQADVDERPYANEKFIEIQPFQLSECLGYSPKETLCCIELTWLSRKPGPWRKFKGGAWRDLFAEQTYWDTVKWMPVTMLEGAAHWEGYKVNYDYRFRLWYCAPGLIHIEMDDEGKWTVEDVVSLPEWMVID